MGERERDDVTIQRAHKLEDGLSFQPPVVSSSSGGSDYSGRSGDLNPQLSRLGSRPAKHLPSPPQDAAVHASPEYSHDTERPELYTENVIRKKGSEPGAPATHLVTGSHSDLPLCAVQSPERKQRTDYDQLRGNI